MPAPEETPPTKLQQKHVSARLPSSPAARLKESDPTWRAKLCLRALAAILALASASCFCTALAIWPQAAQTREYYRWDGKALPTDALPLFPLFYSILFFLLLTTYLFALKRPLHPGIVIASDLAVWVTIGGLGTWVALSSSFWYYVGANAAGRCVKSSNIDIYCNEARKTKGLCELAGLVLLLAVLVAHFALFVWLCREVDVRRKGERGRELEALYLQEGGKDEQGPVASDDGAHVGGGPRAKTKTGERMAEEELSW